MSISHWGIFPGEYHPRNRVTSRPAFWHPMPWDLWCSLDSFLAAEAWP
jgi:hypothetical protein